MSPFLVLFLLCGVALGLKDEDTLEKNESAVPKTFRGKKEGGEYEELSHSILHGLPDTTTNNNPFLRISSNNAFKVASEHTITKVSNSTLVYLSGKVSRELIPGIYIIVVLIGVPANALVLWMLFHQVTSVCTTVLYASLATSDLLYCLMLPFKIAYHLNGNNWIFGETMCRAMTIFLYFNMYCSILLLMCFSINRYVAIVHPFIYRSLPKGTYTVLVCLLVCAIVLVYMIPFFITRQTYHIKELKNIITCHDVYDISHNAFQFYYFISMVVFGFLIPFSVVAFCYFSIIRALTTNEWKRFWYVKITVLFFIIFALCFTPSNLILLIHQVRYHHTHNDDMYGIYLMALCLTSLNSCLDPFLYFLIYKKVNTSKNYNTILKVNTETQAKLLPS
ncbi:proteinase-activated receptor 3 precursor [Xenopus tropicalis]|uniref:Novel 7 transmembrane receptor (Rhodopsin family) proteinNovel 7 transmembrane receptor (Rhodopsin family) protein n=1 Tax=Xenopus tropicalis TaxID=8364 RepID=Q28BQ5_XENTR|nr:proteinase-activated receptor 3 precursor [Xenopus tropicalis]CAJ82389.1 Novel 7 transmembrane receptor (rhodopsin family) proteinNovel 7 transmembrane receptor (rhodopsin family) protein [Xenopus tropicalis]|eukprot:NP_001039234.1 proteinase-activated receptor 3 precursor [Xenopus tropicalis]